MSAYIVSDDHINVVVSYFAGRGDGGLWAKFGKAYDYVTPDNAHLIAYELHRENVRSVNDRYRETGTDELYEFKYLPHVKDVYSPLEIAGALDGLEYQSCESTDYCESDAWSILCNMRKHLLRQMAERELGDETIWTIDEVKPADRVYI